jgi:hypothetical protein
LLPIVVANMLERSSCKLEFIFAPVCTRLLPPCFTLNDLEKFRIRSRHELTWLIHSICQPCVPSSFWRVTRMPSTCWRPPFGGTETGKSLDSAHHTRTKTRKLEKVCPDCATLIDTSLGELLVGRAQSGRNPADLVSLSPGTPAECPGRT